MSAKVGFQRNAFMIDFPDHHLLRSRGHNHLPHTQIESNLFNSITTFLALPKPDSLYILIESCHHSWLISWLQHKLNVGH